jgi:amidohydrolase
VNHSRDRILTAWLAAHEVDVIAARRELHAHPEISKEEKRTTGLVVDWLRALDLRPDVLPTGTGALCTIDGSGPLIGLRADIDALPVPDAKDVPYRSRVPGVCHACGHDAHTAILLGAASVLAAMAAQGELPGRVRLIFQPAEEVLGGGALDVIAAQAMTGVRQIYALHCDPRLDRGQIGIRVGAITAAAASVDVRLSGPGGHTSRPHLTVDLVYALGLLITQLPGLLSRRVDPRSMMSLVWGAVEAGRVTNAIPATGRVRGTVRVLDHDAWMGAEALLRTLIPQIVAPTGADVEIAYESGVPPVVNRAECVDVQRAAIQAALGEQAVADTMQSMGGEDFSWYLEQAPGAMARLGVRSPGRGRVSDIHQSTFDIDEAALAVGVRYTVHTALAAMDAAGGA